MNLHHIAAACAALFAAFVAGDATAQGSYRADAYSTSSVGLNVCNPEVRVSVRGDGDTDLDFRIFNSNGEVVHADDDLTDITFATLYRRGGVDCENFRLEVENLGEVYNQYEITLENQRASNGSSSAEDGFNRRVGLQNQTGETIMYLRWSNSGNDTFGDDRLGSDILSEDQTWTVVVDDGSGACRFDFRAETSSGRLIERWNVDVCSVSTITFN